MWLTVVQLRTHLEICYTDLLDKPSADVNYLEKAQHLTKRLIKGFRNLPYCYPA